MGELTNFGFYKPAEGEDGWASQVNNNADLLEDAFNGNKTIPAIDTDRLYYDTYKIRNSGGSVVVDGPTTSDSGVFSDFADALNNQIQSFSNVIVDEGVYSYSTDPVLPSDTRIHFDGVILEPDGCKGLATGDNSTDFTNQHISGKVFIRANEGVTTATKGIHVYASKSLACTGRVRIESGFSDSGLHIDGGDFGSWWCYYDGLSVNKFRMETTGGTAQNAQVFNGCLFRAQFDFVDGNSLFANDCWFEGIQSGDTVEISGDTFVCDSRFEGVDMNINNANGHALKFKRNTPSLTKNYTENVAGNVIFIQRADGTVEMEYDTDGRSGHQVVDNGAFTSDSESVYNAAHTFTTSGQSNMYRADSERRGGYNFGAFYSGSRRSWVPSGDTSGFAMRPVDGPSTDELPQSNDAMIFVSNGNFFGANGDLVYAVNDGGTIKTSVIAAKSGAT